MNSEYNRLEAVNRFKQLDAGITKDLNEIVDLVAQICNTPVALITLLDQDTQWFKASKGVDIDCTDREISFCNYTIEQNCLTVINDTSIDERFIQNPLVANDPHVRFYAGAPLVTKDGYAIGSLCIIDFEPRVLNDHQQNSLKVLARQVVNLMELNYSLQISAVYHKEVQQQKEAIEESGIKLKAIFDSSNDVHILVGKKFEVLAFNKSASVYMYNIFKKDICHGDNIMHYVDPRLTNQMAKYFTIAMEGRSIKREWIIRPDTEHACWREIKFVPIKNLLGEIIGVVLNSIDITKRKQQERQIKIQNEALTRIAIIQSHELRRPVASLLGIMQLIKMEHIDFDYFTIMETTINELDEKIRDIVKDSETTINKPLSVVA